MSRLAGMDEFGLIAHLSSRLAKQVPAQGASHGIVVGIGDDTSVTRTPAGEDLLTTIDTMVEGIHFTQTTMGWADVGYKAIAASISDIAAMGGQPLHALISIAIPRDVALSALESIYDGFDEIGTRYQCPVIGGDVVGTSGPLVVTSTVVGSVPSGRGLLRSGAQPGDLVFVTGTVGGSGAGLALMQSGGFAPPDEWLELCWFHRRPVPQVTAGQVLRDCGAHSCNDVSDGVASELNEIARASGVRLRVEADRLPIAPAVRNFARRRGELAHDYAWYGGEDYQLVGTAPPQSFAEALARLESIGLSLTRIGRVEPGDGVVVVHPGGRLDVLEPRGFNHFAGD